MTCPTCRAEITGLACVRCAARRSRDEARAQFPSYAEAIRRNRFAMLLRRRHKMCNVEHIALPHYHDEALCGADIRELGFQRREPFRALPDRTCPECNRVLLEALGVNKAASI